MKRLIPRKAPELLLNRINQNYGYAVNCSYPNSFRLLNSSQYEILKAINNRDDLNALSRRFDMSTEGLRKFLVLLGKTDLVRFDDAFIVPQRPKEPKSLNFWIHTTDACNLGCSYCYISTLNTRKGMTNEVRQQLLIKLIETVRQRGIQHIKLRLAGGEPLSQFKVWKAFIPEAEASLADLGCMLDIAFITNLTILNEEIIAFSKKYDISYGISLDGVEGTHDATRTFRSGKGSFHVVNTNVRKLLSENISVSVNTVISNYNLSGLPELTRYLIDLDVPFRYSVVKGETIQADLLEHSLLQSYKIMAQAIESDWQFAKRYQFCDLKPNELGFQTCTSGFSGGAIYVDGSLKYCHVHFGQDNHSGSSIFNPKLDLVEMIEQGEHHEEERSEDCRTCRYRSVCTSGCPVYRVDGKDPQCSLYHRMIPMYYELQAKERLHLLQKHGMV